MYPISPSIMNLDNPIDSVRDDVLGRASIARRFAQNILSLNLVDGAVVAVLGPWGSGKTSFVNLVRTEIEEHGIPFLEFNPWMFKGTRDLIDRFFIDICQQIKKRGNLVNLGRELEQYMKTFPGLIGGTSRIISKLLQGRDLRSTVERTLKNLDTPLVVFIDDIDRLSTEEIRQVFQLVRLTGKFPNILYLLAFDRSRVECALAEVGISGRDYLEKIVQWPFDLPQISRVLLQKHTLTTIDATLAGIDRLGDLEQDDWVATFRDVIYPLIRNVRDVRRYAVAIKTTCTNVGGIVQLADILGLEAIRVFLPSVFESFHNNVSSLTFNDDIIIDDRLHREENKVILNKIIESELEHPTVVRAMLKNHFP